MKNFLDDALRRTRFPDERAALQAQGADPELISGVGRHGLPQTAQECAELVGSGPESKGKLESLVHGAVFAGYRRQYANSDLRPYGVPRLKLPADAPNLVVTAIEPDRSAYQPLEGEAGMRASRAIDAIDAHLGLAPNQGVAASLRHAGYSHEHSYMVSRLIEDVVAQRVLREAPDAGPGSALGAVLMAERSPAERLRGMVSGASAGDIGRQAPSPDQHGLA